MIRFASLSTDARYFRWNFTQHPFDFAHWVKEEEWVWDSDNCGDRTEFYVVMDGDKVTYWKVEHSWWIDYEPEWEIHNVFEITEIDRSGVDEKYAKSNLRFVI